MTAKRRKKPRDADDARNEQLVRILHLIRDLDRVGGTDLYELAERYGTTTRTIRRDLQAITAAGIPVSREEADGLRARWRLDSDSSKRVAKLVELSHFLALRMAMMEARAVRGRQNLYSVMEDLADRIEEALGKDGRARLNEVESAFASWEKFAFKEAPRDVVWPLVEAISRRLICTVTYQSPEKSAPTTFRLLPLKLVVHNGSLYLHAWQPRFDSVFLLNLQRLKSLKVTNEQGAVPKSYNPAALEQSAFGIFIGKDVEKFKLRFSSKAKPWIEERQWHPSQTCTSLRDGGCMLTFTCTPSYEVTGWVLSWRDQVEVLAPESLKDELKKYGQWLGRQYA